MIHVKDITDLHFDLPHDDTNYTSSSTHLSAVWGIQQGGPVKRYKTIYFCILYFYLHIAMSNTKQNRVLIMWTSSHYKLNRNLF